MVQIIAGDKGKGKTKQLIEKVNTAIATATGNIVFLDKNSKSMHEIDRKVRLINVSDYPITNTDEFMGFICGIASQDYDLQEMYIDSFLTIANTSSDDDICTAVKKLDVISEKYNVDFILSVSRNEADLPECAKEKLVVSL